jgi:hypothetical protein
VVHQVLQRVQKFNRSFSARHFSILQKHEINTHMGMDEETAIIWFLELPPGVILK